MSEKPKRKKEKEIVYCLDCQGIIKNPIDKFGDKRVVCVTCVLRDDIDNVLEDLYLIREILVREHNEDNEDL